MSLNPPSQKPWISVIVLNYNGMVWLPRCLESIEKQTVFEHIEVIVTDNNSTDGSARFAAEWLERTGRGRVVQNGANLYYCEANNNGAAVAMGEYLLFLNNDTWLEPTCLEQLYHTSIADKADAASPIVLDYDADSFQDCGAAGFDIFGCPTPMKQVEEKTEIFVAPGCSLLMSVGMFEKIGGFAPELLIYADETDLSWRAWIAGGKIIVIPSARLHHRGAAVVNPKGDNKLTELRTSETKRFLANRNTILFILKNSQHFLLLLIIPHLLMLLAEMLVSLVLVRRWSFIYKSYFLAISGAFQMWPNVLNWRRRIRGFRQRGDFWMLRFFCLTPSRLNELKHILKRGIPKVDAR